jgi:hypothetical protein
MNESQWMKQNVSIAPLLPYHTLATQSMFQASLVKSTKHNLSSLHKVSRVMEKRSVSSEISRRGVLQNDECCYIDGSYDNQCDKTRRLRHKMASIGRRSTAFDLGRTSERGRRSDELRLVRTVRQQRRFRHFEEHSETVNHRK